MKLCECGCGQPTSIAKRNRRGYMKGEAFRFVFGHSAGRRGPLNPCWQGGRVLSTHGYWQLWAGDDETDARRYVYEHIAIAEKALGRPLPKGTEVHHVNEDKQDNRPSNLVVCQDHAYHSLLHLRALAFRECGHASWRRCPFCDQWDAPENLYVGAKRDSYHRSCNNRRRRARYRKRTK